MWGWLHGSRERDDRHLVKGAAAVAAGDRCAIGELGRLLGAGRATAPSRAAYTPAASARGRPAPRGSARAGSAATFRKRQDRVAVVTGDARHWYFSQSSVDRGSQVRR
jgi:hypothetical protein